MANDEKTLIPRQRYVLSVGIVRNLTGAESLLAQAQVKLAQALNDMERDGTLRTNGRKLENTVKALDLLQDVVTRESINWIEWMEERKRQDV